MPTKVEELQTEINASKVQLEAEKAGRAAFEQELQAHAKSSLDKKIEELKGKPLEEQEAREFITREVQKLLWEQFKKFCVYFGIANVIAFLTVIGAAVVAASNSATWVANQAIEAKIGKFTEQIDNGTSKVSALTQQADDLKQKLLPLTTQSGTLQKQYDELAKTYEGINNLDITQQGKIIAAIKAADKNEVLAAIQIFNTENSKSVAGIKAKVGEVALALDKKAGYDVPFRFFCYDDRSLSLEYVPPTNQIRLATFWKQRLPLWGMEQVSR